VHALEARRHLLGQPGGHHGLADATHPQHRHQSTALLQQPRLQSSQFFSAADESRGVRRFTPVLRTVRSGDGKTRGCLRTISAEQPVEPLRVEWGLQPIHLSFDCSPEIACVRALGSGCQAARVEQCANKRP
jgi:hypothetical protein